MLKLLKRIVLLVVLLIVGLFMLALFVGRSDHRVSYAPLPAPPPRPAAAPAGKPADPPVVGVAIMAVKRFLKSPDSASFPPSNEWAREQVQPKRWRVAGEVIASNSFNARVRQPVAVELVDEGETLRVVFVKIGERVEFDVR